MDALQLESFSLSYRWLVSITDGDSNAATAASFIDIDPRLMSQRWMSGADSQDDFDFGNTPDIAHSPTLAHADEIFSGGVVLPLQPVAAAAAAPERDDCDRFLWPVSILSRSTSVDSSSVLLSSLSRRYLPPTPTSESRSVSSTKAPWFGSSASKNVLRRFLYFLMPLLKKIKRMRARVAAVEGRRKRTSKTGFDRYRRPSRATVAAVVDEGLEKSIHEAVLHCKKSIGNN